MGYWTVAAAGAGATVASLLNFLENPPKIKPADILHYEFLAEFLLLIPLIVCLFVLYQHSGQKVRQRRAIRKLHLMLHEIRDLIQVEQLTAIQEHQMQYHRQQWQGGYEVPPQLVEWMLQACNAIKIVFAQLLTKGSAMAVILVPESRDRISAEPSHLVLGPWSVPAPTETAAVARAEALKARRIDDPIAVEIGTFERPRSLAGWSFLRLDSTLIRDTRRDLGPLPFDVTPGRTEGEDTYKYIRAAITVPIVVNNESLFVLSIVASEPRQLRPEHIELARCCADTIGIICKISGLYPHELPDEPPAEQHARDTVGHS